MFGHGVTMEKLNEVKTYEIDDTKCLELGDAYGSVWTDISTDEKFQQSFWPDWVDEEDDGEFRKSRKEKEFLNRLFVAAFRAGNLTGHVKNNDALKTIPRWYWAEEKRALKTVESRWTGFDYRLPMEWRSLSGKMIIIKAAEFEAFQNWREDSASIMSKGIENEEAPSKPKIAGSEPLPEQPYIELRQAINWVAFGFPLSITEFHISDDYDSRFSNEILQEKLEDAAQKVFDKALAGDIEIVGKWAENGAADACDMDVIPAIRFHDYRRLGIIDIAGLLYGTSMGPVSLEEALNGPSGEYRNVKVKRSDFAKYFKRGGEVVPRKRGAPKGSNEIDDNEHLKEMASLVTSGMSKHAAAKKIAEGAPGQSYDSTVKRLEDKFRELQAN